MELVNRNVYLKIKTKNFGTLPIYLNDKENKIGNGYFVTATKGRKHLAGFVDYQGNEIIPFQEMKLEECFYTEDYHNICLGFKLPDTENLLYYHIQENEDKTDRVVCVTSPYDEVPLVFRPIEDIDDIWVMETISQYPQQAMYSVKEAKLLTTFFDSLSFELDRNPYGHFACFQKNITSYIDEEEVVHTTILGFLNEKGSFSSQLLDCKTLALYNSYSVGENSLSKNFNNYINALRTKYESKLYKEEDDIDNVMENLFNNFNLSEKPIMSKPKAKIIPFSKK